MKKPDVSIWCFGALSFFFTILSCQVEDIPSEKKDVFTTNPQSKVFKNPQYNFVKPKTEIYSLNQLYFDDGIINSPCPVTKFGEIISNQFDKLIEDPYFDFRLINYLSDLNRRYVTYYEGENYYGINGEYNQLANKRIRELEKFWKLNRDIRLNGQHTSTLTDREILTDMIESFDRTVRNRDQAYEKADGILKTTSKSANIPENPLFAMDAFTRSNGLLVIGDGLLESLEALGIDGKIAFTAIISHEWWHQAQFENSDHWGFIDQLETNSERSRFAELEADFAAAYFMTHKRGATYNWWRIKDYFTLSFNVGDCLIDSEQHHGTPTQRLAAAEFGYQLASEAQKKGFILEPDEVHEEFVKWYVSIIQ
ncbi:hypothetical protein ML462_10070 [Gramella lutea]|uniref:Uncharacterized protein n=1 Tax=Christiangramia lutea TaxID=1607951 RepID=A0A9X1V5Y7_9FLAO|nr:hypothetical protein [Christiangramia lutea]MCH4823514.1 hypothetical protein [Christiangramia lutea]